MVQAQRAIAVIIFTLFVLTGCGGESSGESSGDSNGNSTPTTTVSSNDPVVLSGSEFYQGGADLDDEYQCVLCHGLNGEGGAFQAINTNAVCPSCTDVVTLAADIAATMPVGDTGACVGSTPGSCAYDIAAFMMDQWIIPNIPTPGITVNAAANLMTDESGATATFTIQLDSEPQFDVNIAISSDNVNEGTVSPAMVSFNSTDWNQAKSVVVTGVDDGNVDGNIVFNVITAAAISQDPDYNGLNADDVVVTNNDNDVAIPAGINISQVSGLITDENGVSVTVDFSLASMPSADVTVSLLSSDLTEGTVAPATLTFTPQNYNNLQTITITGADDNELDGSIAYMIMTGVSSVDAEYAALNPSDIAVTNNDNEVPPPASVVVTPTMGLVTSEAGAGPGLSTFTVVLGSMPGADVVIPLSSSDVTEGTVNPASLTFSAANWNVPQSVSIMGVNDQEIDGNIQYTIVTGDPSSADAGYDALTAANVADVTVTNMDDDALIAGKAAYELASNACVLCHGAQGEGTVTFYNFNIGPVNNMCGVVDCLNAAELATYLENEMPVGNEANCDATCASNITSYMLNNFSTTP